NVHGRIGGICAPPSVVAQNDAFVVTFGDTTDLPIRGVIGNVAWDRTCPAGSALIGFRGRAGALIDQLTLTCAPLVITAAMDGTWSIAAGAPVDLPAVGDNGGAPFPQTNCPAGQ